MIKRGFTLVEILIVLAIVSLLGMMAINGYLEYRRSALLDLSADSFVAQIGELKEKTVQGQVRAGRADEIRANLDGAGAASADVTSLCNGLRFDKQGDYYDLKTFTQKFDPNKRWYGEGDGWLYEGCGDPSVNILNEGILDLDENIRVVDVFGGEDSSLGTFNLRFSPPDGHLELIPGASSSFQDLNIVLQYDNDSGARKTIEFNLVNGNAHVLK